MTNFEQAAKYLTMLDSNADKFLFACYDYRKIEKGKQLYGSFDSAKKTLEKLNKSVFCVYVTVNETDNSGKRKKENIKRARAIWVEDDNRVEEPRTDWPLTPSLVVESSPNKYHYYWFTSTVKLDEWDQVMATMVNDFGCDNKAKDRARVLRLPGFYHRKDLKSPHPCKIISGEGKHYKWFEIKAKFKPSEQTGKERPKAQAPTEYSEEAAIKSLLTSENYHGSLVSISMSLTNKGLSRELQYMTLFGLMNKIPPDKRRPEWEARTSDEHLYECIDSGIKKKQEEDANAAVERQRIEELQDIGMSFKQAEEETEFPPGNIGELCKEILEMAPYPNREIALAGGMALVAGIIGRTYNVIGMGLNIYIAILADSGIGKANLKDSINNALRAGGGKFNIGETFAGRSRFTGPKAIFDMLKNGMSKVCVIEEAGLVSDGAGDQSGITRALLDLYTSCGYGKWAGDEGYSDSKNNIPALHSPALTVVNVSTPKSFLRALKDKSADVSGEVARLWMMRSIGEKPYLNRDRRKDFSQRQIALLGKFISNCLANQNTEEDLHITEIEVTDEFVNLSDRWVDLENKYIRENDHLRRTMCSRAWAKIIKMAAICSVYNGKTEIGKEEYEWAERTIERELKSIIHAFTYETTDDLGSIAKSTVAPTIVNLLMGKYNGVKTRVDPKLAERGIFTYTNIAQASKGNTVLQSIDDDTSKPNPRTGLDKVLYYMYRAGLLTILDKDKLEKYGSTSHVGYKITADFYNMYMVEKKKETAPTPESNSNAS